MSGVNIFKNNTGSLPKSDDQIVRIDMDKSDIGGRKSHLPAQSKSGDLSLSHVPNSGGSK
jgi:hypothetical protein